MQTNDQLSLGSHVGRWEGEGCERQHQLSRSVSDATASRTRGQSRPRLPFSFHAIVRQSNREATEQQLPPTECERGPPRTAGGPRRLATVCMAVDSTN